MQNNSKINTVLLVVLIVLVGFGIYIISKNNQTVVVKDTQEQTPNNQASINTPVNNVYQSEQNIQKNNPINTSVQNNKQFNQYNNNGLSFNYDKNATEQTLNGSYGPYHRINVSGGDFPDSLTFFKGAVPEQANACNSTNIQLFGIQIKTTVINGKTFTYCDNTQGEKIRTYIYKKDGGTVIVSTPQSSSKLSTGYIDLGSIELQLTVTDTQKTYQGNGFSFNYNDAKGKLVSGIIPNYGYYAEISNANKMDTIHFYTGAMPSNFQADFYTGSIVINGKTFLYGDVQTETGVERAYMYKKNGKTIIIQNNSFINLDSIEIQ